MQSSSLAITGLGLAVMAVSAGAACDPAFNAYSIVGASSTHGHTVILRGTDNVVRISEFDESTAEFGRWLTLSSTSEIGGSTYSDAWIQDPVSGSGNFAYSFKGDSLIQWRLGQYSSTWAVFRSVATGNSGITSGTRPTSARLSSTIKTAVIANFGGTLKYRTQVSGVWSSWVALPGVSNAIGSPWAAQISSTVVNVYTRTADGMIAQVYWNGTAWAYAGTPVTSGVNSDPASIYDAATGYHYLYYVGTNGVAYKVTYTGSWNTAALSVFPAQKSLAPVMVGGSVVIYGQTYQNDTYDVDNSGTSSYQTNCNIPY